MTTTLTFTDPAGKQLATLDVTEDYHVQSTETLWETAGTKATASGPGQLITPTVDGGEVIIVIVDAAGSHPLVFDHPNGPVTITAKVKPPPPTGPALPPIPAGYTQKLLLDFTKAAAQALVKKRTAGKAQGGIECWCKPENVTFDPQVGLRLATRMEVVTGSDGVTYQYSGAYCDIGSANAADRIPLECVVEWLYRGPLDAENWYDPAWFCAFGSAGNLEVDGTETFTSQTPGYTNFQVHHPTPKGPGKNLIRGTGDGKPVIQNGVNYGATTIHGQPQGALPLAPGVASGSERRGVQSYSIGPASGWVPGHTGWHVGRFESEKVLTGGTGWRPRFKFSLDGIPCVTWEDTYTPDGQKPSWWQGTDEQRVWDIRFDNWVGGLDIQRATLNGKPLLVPDGKRQDGTTTYQAPAAAMPPPTLWQQDPKAVYSLDIGAVRVLTKAA